MREVESSSADPTGRRLRHTLELAIEIGNSICVARLFEMEIVHVRWRDALFIADYPLKNYPLNLDTKAASTETKTLSRIRLLGGEVPQGSSGCCGSLQSHKKQSSSSTQPSLIIQTLLSAIIGRDSEAPRIVFEEHSRLLAPYRRSRH